MRCMDASAWISLVATVVAVAALICSWVLARASRQQAASAKDQAEITRQLRIDSAQPYVWVDMRPDEQHAGLLVLMVGNSGPTVATDVRVTFQPDLDIPRSATVPNNSRGADARDLLRRGIKSLPPGRVMQWNLGAVHQLINDGYALAYTATITAEGPFGPTPRLAYTIDVEDIRYTLAVPPGTLHGVTQAVQSLTRSVDQAVREFRNAGRDISADAEPGLPD